MLEYLRADSRSMRSNEWGPSPPPAPPSGRDNSSQYKYDDITYSNAKSCVMSLLCAGHGMQEPFLQAMLQKIQDREVEVGTLMMLTAAGRSYGFYIYYNYSSNCIYIFYFINPSIHLTFLIKFSLPLLPP